MAISYVDFNSGATSCAMPNHAIGDLIIIAAYFVGNGLPTLGSGFTNLGTVMSGTAAGSRIGYRVAVGTNDAADPSGTWTGSAALEATLYRGTGLPGAIASNSGSSTAVGYPALTMNQSGSSWAHRAAAHVSATNLNSVTLTGYTLRCNGSGVVSFDSNAAVTNPSTGSQTVNASGAWMTWTVEIQPPASTATNRFFYAM